MLITTDKKFSMHLWCCLIPHANMTFNLVQACRHNPKLTAHEALGGPFIYDAAPAAPPGCKVIGHEIPQQRKSRAPHSQDGFYLGPAMQHYRCHHVYLTKTHGEQILETVDFQPKICENPVLSNEENVIIAASKLIAALQTPNIKQKLDLQTMKVIKQLAKIFQHQINKKSEKEAAPAPKVVIERPAPPRVKTEPSLTTQSAPPPRVHKNILHVIPPDDTHTPANNVPHRYPIHFQFSQHQANTIVTEDGKMY